ncbi:hypothetical protein PF004_g18977 [Phytophthora fragariae]|uniref:Uncharacterized protein n=2 Tax=Phytophthora fragariae TaxID=53985 RepID=A0A6A3EF67_9STRA|nr:hypothetical protein PF009_g21122 [Phytophthora fragariae]KAE9200514.1 hypothetical protein PF004_g18977 [Phytophthora fragariae]
MDTRQPEMDRRWGFLLPWCRAVKDLIKYKRVDREWEFWSDESYFLEVKLPMRCGMTEDENGDEYEYGMEWSGENEFKKKFKKVREALALLAAVAHVDQSAWKYLLSRYCAVKLGGEWDAKFARDIRADYYLDQDEDWRTMDEDHIGLDLVLFCGVDHRTNPSKDYVKALAQIAALNTNLTSTDPGVDVVIPVRCFYPCHGISKDGGEKIMKNVLVSEKTIQEMWQRLEQQQVSVGELRCTFVLKPMIADLDGIMDWPEMAKRVGKLMSKSMWFSEVKLTAQTGCRRIDDDSEARKVFGQVMAHLFGSTRRSREVNYCSELEVGAEASTQLQLDTLIMKCDPELRAVDVQAMSSAMVVNQTTKNLAMILDFPGLDRASTEEWWQWIAYSFFSKRAPELFGCPRGQVDDRDATLNANAPILWEFDYRGQPVEDSTPLTYPTPVQAVRTFSDDGSSEWVNAIVPGFGRCRVQRRELVFSDVGAVEVNSCSLISLTLSFEKFERTFSDGLPYFLTVIGPSLKSLTLDVPELELGEEEILEICPNLEKLSICGRVGDAQFNFSDFRLDEEDSYGLDSIDWHSVRSLTRALSCVRNPFVQCVRKLRVYPSLNPSSFARETKALQYMLKKNRSVEYLEVGTMEEHAAYIQLIQKHNHERVDRSIKVPIASKVAFLSVLSANTSPTGENKTSTPVLREVYLQRDYGEELEELDSDLEEAGLCMQRVYFQRTQQFREPYVMSDDYEDNSTETFKRKFEKST